MSSIGAAFAPVLWSLYILGTCMIMARIVSRLMTFGASSKLQLDDWLMLFILIPFTGAVFCANEVIASGDSWDSVVREQSRALKLRLALEEFQLSADWLVKACLLVLYQRIFPQSRSRKERRCILPVIALCFVSFLAIQVLLPIWCRPVRQYWALPSDNVQCVTYENHSILALAFDTTTTLLVLILPVPSIPTPRKFLQSILLVLGILAFVAGILGRTYVITKPGSLVYLPWYIAEVTLMIVFANVPFLTSLIICTSTTRVRQMSSTLSQSNWPRSYKDTPPLRARPQRLDINATDISTLPDRYSKRLGSVGSTIALSDAEDIWTNDSNPPSLPPTPTRRLTLTDPPPELQMYWTTHRPSTRDTDMVTMPETTQWPLR